MMFLHILRFQPRELFQKAENFTSHLQQRPACWAGGLLLFLRQNPTESGGRVHASEGTTLRGKLSAQNPYAVVIRFRHNKMNEDANYDLHSVDTKRASRLPFVFRNTLRNVAQLHNFRASSDIVCDFRTNASTVAFKLPNALSMRRFS